MQRVRVCALACEYFRGSAKLGALRFPLIPAHQTAGRAEQMQTDRGTALLWYLDLPDLLSPYTVLLLSLYLYVILCERHSMGCLSLCLSIPFFLGLNTVLIGSKQRH